MSEPMASFDDILPIDDLNTNPVELETLCPIEPLNDNSREVLPSVSNMRAPVSDYPYGLSVPSWSYKSPESWSPDEFAGWLCYWAAVNGVPDSELIYLLYEPLSGFELCALGHQFFSDLCPQYGLAIFEALHQMVTVWSQNNPPVMYNHNHHGQFYDHHRDPTSPYNYRTFIIYDIENTPPKIEPPRYEDSHIGLAHERRQIAQIKPNNVKQIVNDMPTSTTVETRGRPRGSIRGSAVEPRTKTGKLWQFLIQLLSNPKTNPSLIQWVNEEDGRFKFNECDKVAKLWGRRNYNTTMTYDKMSRAIRYYYKQEVLLPVPGQTHVYRFGPNAKLWLNKFSYFRG